MARKHKGQQQPGSDQHSDQGDQRAWFTAPLGDWWRSLDTNQQAKAVDDYGQPLEDVLVAQGVEQRGIASRLSAATQLGPDVMSAQYPPPPGYTGPARRQ